ncbi:DNA polymerase-1 [Sporomusaceae bacterium BoRhaA]|uniref:DNA polymerase I n=1 Tax=Pelorhabdus rhamnosifermentans TaxID=2772457 RepID=UPI001C05FEDD|nr:DNA polymerase I [Pelorhabdus rhamnosifermentans]MBU2702465.1 DNA polymerase-1 [Pelorhabdus rhamnosifermentans]
MSEKIIIIDGSSLMYRAFFALPLLTTASGQYTNAVYGFTNMLVKLMADVKPDKVVVAFDKGKLTFRNDLYAEYKGGRQATPTELSVQFPLIQQVLASLGIAVLELAGYEADDIIGTLACQSREAGQDVLIVTGDRDALQLVGDSVQVLLTRKGISHIEQFDAQAVQEKYAVSPAQIIDLKGLMGDASDNIPGVSGVGEKTAVKLLAQFGTVENLLDHIDDVSGAKLKEKLYLHADLARLSKTLATIDCHVPLEGLPADFTVRPDEAKMKQLFSELGFKSLLARFVTSCDESAEIVTCPQSEWDCSFQTIDSSDLAAQVSAELRQAGEFVFCPLWQGKVPELELTGVTVLVKEKLFFFPMEYLPVMVELWADETIAKITHDAKPIYQYGKLQQFAIRNLLFDVSLAAYLVDPAASQYNLADLSAKYLTESFPAEEELLLGAARDTQALSRLYPLLLDKLKEANLLTLYQEIELPLQEVLAALEVTGITVDQTGLIVMNTAITEKITALLTTIYQLAGEEFNVNSTKQLGRILFDKLKLPVLKKTKTGYSTNAEVLERLAVEFPHPLLADLLEYRTLTKLKSTYLDGLKPLIHQETGRIHTTFNQTVTTTGRLSSSDPNLQNIPVRSEEGRKIRSLFIPGGEWQYLMSADYSQIELRVLAHMSGDMNLIEAFKHNQDIHSRTAAKVFGVDVTEVTSEMRSRAKAVNFGIVYGISDYGLSRDIHVTRKEAAQYIESYFDMYRGVKELMDSMVAKAHEEGFVTTMFGRRRYLPDINSRNFNLRSFAERTAMNTPIQGTAADIIKKAMITVYDKINQEGLQSRILLQVHDELVLEVTEKEIPRVAALVKETMENIVLLRVPLVADVKVGPNWALAK